MRTYPGFRLIDGTVDNSRCPHLHLEGDGREIRCQTCGYRLPTKEREIRDIVERLMETDGYKANSEWLGPSLHRILDTINGIQYDSTGHKLNDKGR